jgi:hypothetical protein
LGQGAKRDDDGKQSHFNPFLAKQTGHEMVAFPRVTYVCNNINNLAKVRENWFEEFGPPIGQALSLAP